MIKEILIKTYKINMEGKVFVIGHKNPDTDSIVSAIVYARKKNAIPARAGELNPETEYVLSIANVEKPVLKEKIEKDEKVIIVDTNNKEELIPIEGEIVEIVDHHRLFGNIETSKPIEVTIKPLGSTSTIIAEKYIDSLSKEEALLLLSGILSDTVVFKSPTTTERDIEVAKRLAEIAGIDDIEKFGIELKSKASMLDDNPKVNVTRDFKETTTSSGKRVGIGQVEIVDFSQVFERKEEYENALEEVRKERGLDAVFFMVTNIIEASTVLMFSGVEKEAVYSAFNVEEERYGYPYLKNVLSRKKQVMPVVVEKI